jgi:hypothetical protein
MQTGISSMNTAFSPQNIGKVDPKGFRPSQSLTLSAALRTVPRHGLSAAVFNYLDGWPTALQAAVVGAIYNNLTRAATVPITFAWTPGYDYSVAIHDILDTATTHGGMTILFTSRYPSDTHPLNP